MKRRRSKRKPPRCGGNGGFEDAEELKEKLSEQTCGWMGFMICKPWEFIVSLELMNERIPLSRTTLVQVAFVFCLGRNKQCYVVMIL